MSDTQGLYPIQPMELVNDVLRFEKNPIVEMLLDSGGIDMNMIAIWCIENSIDKKYKQQFAQLIGYSVSGYGTLSYVTDENWERVNTNRRNTCQL